MSDCVCLPNCPFFHDKMAEMPSMADIYKTRYCQGDNSECARYAVYKALGPGNVPSDLYPNQMAQAMEFLGR